MAGGGGGSGPVAVTAREDDGWLRVYNRLVAMLPRVEALAAPAGRARLEAINALQHEFWESRDALLQRRLLQAEESRMRWEAAYINLQPSGDDGKFAELQESESEDLTTFVGLLDAENTEFQIRVKEVDVGEELTQNAADHEHITRDLEGQLRELKQAYVALCSEKDNEIGAMQDKFRKLEQDKAGLVSYSRKEAARATEVAKELQNNVEQLQVASQKKDDEIHRLRARAKAVEPKRKLVQEKLQEMYGTSKEIDGEIKKLKCVDFLSDNEGKNGTDDETRKQVLEPLKKKWASGKRVLEQEDNKTELVDGKSHDESNRLKTCKRKRAPTAPATSTTSTAVPSADSERISEEVEATEKAMSRITTASGFVVKDLRPMVSVEVGASVAKSGLSLAVVQPPSASVQTPSLEVKLREIQASVAVLHRVQEDVNALLGAVSFVKELDKGAQQAIELVRTDSVIFSVREMEATIQKRDEEITALKASVAFNATLAKEARADADAAKEKISRLEQLEKSQSMMEAEVKKLKVNLEECKAERILLDTELATAAQAMEDYAAIKEREKKLVEEKATWMWSSQLEAAKWAATSKFFPVSTRTRAGTRESQVKEATLREAAVAVVDHIWNTATPPEAPNAPDFLLSRLEEAPSRIDWLLEKAAWRGTRRALLWTKTYYQDIELAPMGKGRCVVDKDCVPLSNKVMEAWNREATETADAIAALLNAKGCR